MMASQDQWVLFGLDLRPYVAQVSLAYRQLVWGEESGLRVWLSSPAKLWVEGVAEPTLIDPFGNECRKVNGAASKHAEAVFIDERFVLQRCISLPESVESQLPQAVQFEVQTCSPFESAATRFGFRVLRRGEGELTVGIIITSDEFVDAALARHPAPSAVTEIWSSLEGAMIRINDSQNAVARDLEFARRAGRLAVGLVAGLVLLLLLLTLPTALANIRLEHYREQLLVAEKEAAGATASREELLSYSEKLSLASELIIGRYQYGAWLHALAELSPDSVYLKQLEFSDGNLSIRGYGQNAAAYQSQLVESERFSDVTATSPFRRNPQLELEEFTFELTLQPGATPQEAEAAQAIGGL